ncbi:MAG: ABC transporter ATP-binding protein [Oscillospiraceae bacterium]
MLEIRHLSKLYGQNCVVDDVSFTIGTGEIVGFLGENGAGKSTTMNMITGYLASSRGDILIDGINMLEEPIKAKGKIGYLPEKPPLYPDMTVGEYLDFIFDLKGVKLNKKEHIAKLCALLQLENVYGRLIKNLSKGYCQRVGIAQALVGDPPIIILDEPTVGLDPVQIIEIRELILSLGKTKTVILSSHILSEVQAVCQRIILLNHGKIIADSPAENLVGSGTDILTLKLSIMCGAEGEPSALDGLLRSLPCVNTAKALPCDTCGAQEFLIEASSKSDVYRDVFTILAANGFYLTALSPYIPTLEEIFISLVGVDNGQCGQDKEV